MVKHIYHIRATSVHGADILLVRDIECKEEARNLLAQIVKQTVQRKARFMSLGNVVFDPSAVMAYELVEREVFEESDRLGCDCDDDADIGVVEIGVDAEAEPAAEAEYGGDL